LCRPAASDSICKLRLTEQGGFCWCCQPHVVAVLARPTKLPLTLQGLQGWSGSCGSSVCMSEYWCLRCKERCETQYENVCWLYWLWFLRSFWLTLPSWGTVWNLPRKSPAVMWDSLLTLHHLCFLLLLGCVGSDQVNRSRSRCRSQDSLRTRTLDVCESRDQLRVCLERPLLFILEFLSRWTSFGRLVR